MLRHCPRLARCLRLPVFWTLARPIGHMAYTVSQSQSHTPVWSWGPVEGFPARIVAALIRPRIQSRLLHAWHHRARIHNQRRRAWVAGAVTIAYALARAVLVRPHAGAAPRSRRRAADGRRPARSHVHGDRGVRGVAPGLRRPASWRGWLDHALIGGATWDGGQPRRGRRTRSSPSSPAATRAH